MFTSVQYECVWFSSCCFFSEEDGGVGTILSPSWCTVVVGALENTDNCHDIDPCSVSKLDMLVDLQGRQLASQYLNGKSMGGMLLQHFRQLQQQGTFK